GSVLNRKKPGDHIGAVSQQLPDKLHILIDAGVQHPVPQFVFDLLRRQLLKLLLLSLFPPAHPPGGTLHSSSPSGFKVSRQLEKMHCSPFRAKKKHPEWGAEIDDKPPGSFRKKSARGCMFMG